jgi:hypothetical protein
VPVGLEKASKAEFAGDAPEQGAESEVDFLGRRCLLPVEVPVDDRDVVTRVGRGIAVDRIGIEHA